MKTSLVLLAALRFALAKPSLGEALSLMPSCALPCVVTAAGASSCSITDLPCLCENAPLQQNITDCVLGSCSIKEALFTKNLTSATCGITPRNRSNQLILLSNTLGTITGLLVLQRFLFKIFCKLDIFLEDWFALLTTIVGVPATVINRYGLPPNGIGRDVWTLTGEQITSFGKFFYAMEVIYFSQVGLLKLSLLFFYIRLFSSSGGVMRNMLWATTIFTSLFCVAFVLVAIFQCKPISHFWNKWDDKNGTCLSINAIAWSNAGISIVLDFWMLAIPVSQLKKMQLSWKKKLGAMIMFGTGTFVTVVSILRLHLLVRFGSDSLNPTWEYFDITCWSTVEMNLGIICICLPSLRLMLIRTFPRLRDTIQQYYAKHGTGSVSAATMRRERWLSGEQTGISLDSVAPPLVATKDLAKA